MARGGRERKNRQSSFRAIPDNTEAPLHINGHDHRFREASGSYRAIYNRVGSAKLKGLTPEALFVRRTRMHQPIIH